MTTTFIVDGARKDTGAEERLFIDAENARAAEQIANDHGLMVSGVRPIESHVEGKPAGVGVADAIGNLDSICPYCNHDLAVRPRGKKKCPHCGQFIHVRTRPCDGRKVLVTVAQVEQIQEQWFMRQGGTHEQFLYKKKRVEEEQRRLAERLAHTNDPMEIARLLIADGLAHGRHPMEVARRIAKATTGISRQEAEKLAQSEIMRGHAERTLDSMEELGEEADGKMEWSTAGDDGVCPACASMDGRIFTLKDARGKMPHPQCSSSDGCRCCWLPVIRIPKT